MQIPTIIRRFEFWLILGTSFAITANTLVRSAWKFEDHIRIARLQSVSVKTILKDLSLYDHTFNYNVPIILAMLFSFAAWYLFHFKIIPKCREGTFNQGDTLTIILMTGLLLAAAIALGNVNYMEYRVNGDEKIMGFKISSYFRKLYVLSDLTSIFIILCFYEVLSQLFYESYTRVITQFEEKNLHYILLAAICASVLLFAISPGIVSVLFYSSGIRQTGSLFLFLLLVYILQEYYFKKVFTTMHTSSKLPVNPYPTVIYIASLLLGTGLIWANIARFKAYTPTYFILTAIVLSIASLMIVYLRKNQQKEKEVLQTQVSTQSAELSNLRSQINPHFLFNALNSLYALALKENSEQTADGIQKLGDMMRFMLHETNHERISLKSEIQYLHNYIDIQRMRLDESQNIEIRVNIQDHERESYIAPMLLNPFIENAFKHGISFQKPSWIYITLTMDETKIYFKVHNSFHKPTGFNPEESMERIGLENVKKRLQLIYPSRHTLEIQHSESDFFIALTLTYC